MTPIRQPATGGDDAHPDQVWWAFADGASRGNPGPAGAGWVMGPAEGPMTLEGGRFLGRRTNNEAEYLAAILAVRDAVARKVRRLVLHADSQLLVRQLTGVYQVRHPNIRPLYDVLTQEVARAGIALTPRHVPRERNRAADACANAAIDAHFAAAGSRPAS